MKTIEWNDINLKGKSSGQIKTTCPACTPERKNKSDRCLSVNIAKGVAKYRKDNPGSKLKTKMALHQWYETRSCCWQC